MCEAGDLDPPFPRIVFANEAMARLTGYDQRELEGQTPRLFQGASTDPETRAGIRKALAGKRKHRAEVLNYAKDGQTYWVEMDVVPVVDPDSGHLFFVSFERDITRWKRLEAELSEANERADRATRGRNDFIATAIRELRLSVGSLLGHLELLEQGEMTALQPPLIAASLRNAHNLADRLDDILDLDRVDAGATDPGQVQSLNLRDFVADIDLLFGAVANRSGLHFETVLGGGLPTTVDVDIPHLRQLVTCLVRDAMRRTETGGIAVVLEGCGEGRLQVAVHDSGATRDEDSLGVGVARRIAGTLGTGLGIDLAPGEGLSCWIDLAAPGASAAADPRGFAEWRQAMRAGAQIALPKRSQVLRVEKGEPVRVLVADSDPMERATLARQLQSLGARVDIVANGAQALIMATAETPYDLVLFDIGLPIVAGGDLVRGLRAHEELHGLPRVQAVALADETEKAEGAGADLVLLRPVGLGQLVDLLNTGDEAPSDQPAIDLAVLKARLDIADSFDLASVLAVFAEKLDDLERGLARAIARRDAETANDLLHALTAEADWAVAQPLQAAVSRCRLAVGNNDWDFADRSLQRLASETLRIRAVLDGMLGA
ncbi:PAS domain-containing protein [Zavarzinia sp.]|uniref:PAS domain-containing protein n=1 Tax=Zavarzinia sp. TaxID=2027920 RepID=UPI0035689818